MTKGITLSFFDIYLEGDYVVISYWEDPYHSWDDKMPIDDFKAKIDALLNGALTGEDVAGMDLDE